MVIDFSQIACVKRLVDAAIATATLSLFIAPIPGALTVDRAAALEATDTNEQIVAENQSPDSTSDVSTRASDLGPSPITPGIGGGSDQGLNGIDPGLLVEAESTINEETNREASGEINESPMDDESQTLDVFQIEVP